MPPRTWLRTFSLVVCSVLASTFAGCGAEAEPTDAASMAKAAAALGSVNGLCPIMDRLVLKEGGSAEYHGKKVAFCCPGCVGKFREDPERWIAKMTANPTKYGYTP